VEHGVGDGRPRTDCTQFTDALGAKRAGSFVELVLDERRVQFGDVAR
jgi:hypothetical protein